MEAKKDLWDNTQLIFLMEWNTLANIMCVITALQQAEIPYHSSYIVSDILV